VKRWRVTLYARALQSGTAFVEAETEEAAIDLAEAGDVRWREDDFIITHGEAWVDDGPPPVTVEELEQIVREEPEP
jgi:hypothetical protein